MSAKPDQTITLVVDTGFERINFRIKRSSPFTKLFEAYCGRQNLNRKSVRFTFNGRQLDSADTPSQLDMADNDVINAVQDSLSG